MPPQIGDILLGKAQIAARVHELGATLTRAYAGREPVVVAIMKGCVLFLADLIRAWDGPLGLECVSAESYSGTQPGNLRLALPPELGPRVAGRPVVVVDDIYDTGRTLTAVCGALETFKPAEVKTLVLLRKRRAGPASPSLPPLRLPDWVGFEVPDRFVIGYGLDHNGRFRNLPYVAFLREA